MSSSCGRHSGWGSRTSPVIAGFAVVGVLAALAIAPAGGASADQPSATAASAATTLTSAAAAAAPTARARLRFEPNVGQAPASVRYLARGPAQTAWLDPTGISIAASARSAEGIGRAGGSGRTTAATRAALAQAAVAKAAAPAGQPPVRLSFVGAAATARAVPTGRAAGVSNYLIGSDPAGWHTGVPAWSGLRFANVYPGIDVRYSADPAGGLRFDALVAPGADPSRLRLRVPDGATLAAESSGDLMVRTGSGPPLRLHRPTTYQPEQPLSRPMDPTKPVLPAASERGRAAVASSFRVSGRDVTVALGHYDSSRPLVIDPTITYSTPFPEPVADLAVDRTGAVYVASQAVSARAPMHRLGPAGGYNAVVAKLDRTGSALEWITYLGGSSYDEATAISADPDGGVLVTGNTSSPDFPLHNPTRSRPAASFLAKLSGSGAALDFGSYIGDGHSFTVDVAAGPGHRAQVLLSTKAAGLPLVGPGARALRGDFDGYLTAIDVRTGRVAFGGYLGGSQSEYPSALAVGADGTSYVTGSTDSTDFPVRHPVQAHPGGDADGFLAAVDRAGRLVTGSYLGGADYDTPNDVAVSGTAVAVVGGTYSTDFPVRGAAQGRSGGYQDAFLTRFGSRGGSLLSSTYLGGANFDEATKVAIGPDGTTYLAGYAGKGFPTVAPVPGQVGPLFLAGLGSDGRLKRATLLGTSAAANAAVNGIGTDPVGAVTLGGHADPGTIPMLHPLPYGGGDGFLTRLALFPPTVPTCAGIPVTITGTAGADRLMGTSGADVIDGRGGDDIIDGRGGDDVICGGPGADRLLGGAGRDVLRGEGGADYIDGGAGPDAIDGGPGPDQLRGGSGDDTVAGGPAADEIAGGAGRDVLSGGAGDDRLLGGPGNDTMVGGADRDVCLGGTDPADTAVECEVARCALCWQPAATPPVSGEAQLIDVAGTDPGSAWAVGVSRDPHGVVRGLVEQYTGSVWRVVPVPIPASSQLLSVAVDHAEVWAVGASFDRAGAARPLVLHGIGGTWQTLPSPAPSGGLSGVTVQAGRVWVSGTDGGPVVARWNGTAWSQLPKPPGIQVASDVALDERGTVWTAGWRYISRLEGVATTAVAWTGTRWLRSPLGPPAEPGVDQDVNDVSYLPGLGIRIAVAFGDFRGGASTSLLVAPTDPAPSLTFSGFTAEKGAGTRALAWLVGFTATGEYYDPGPQQPSGYRWDGHTFRLAPMTSFGLAATLFSTAVSPDGHAWAVGGYIDGTGNQALILEHRGR